MTIFTSVALVLALLLGLSGILLRLAARGRALVGGALGIRVLERAMIGQGQNVVVVAVGEQILILGATAGSITRLGGVSSEEMDRCIDAQKYRRNEVKRTAMGGRFGAIVSMFSTARSGKPDAAGAVKKQIGETDFSDILHISLKGSES